MLSASGKTESASFASCHHVLTADLFQVMHVQCVTHQQQKKYIIKNPGVILALHLSLLDVQIVVQAKITEIQYLFRNYLQDIICSHLLL